MRFQPFSSLADALVLANTGARVLIVSTGAIGAQRDFQEARSYPAAPGATRAVATVGQWALHYPGGGCARILPGHAARGYQGWDAISIPTPLLHLAPLLSRGARDSALLLAR